MSDKKENIIKAALELFANDGYNATSTSKIAKKANVSEGLIFRHFKNKKSLLDAIVKDAEQRLHEGLAPIIFENNPKAVIRKTLEIYKEIPVEDHDFWKLQFKLKWEKDYHNPHKMKPLIDKLSWAFDQLDYENPEQEAMVLNQLIEGMSIGLLRDGVDPSELRQFLLAKYKV